MSELMTETTDMAGEGKHASCGVLAIAVDGSEFLDARLAEQRASAIRLALMTPSLSSRSLEVRAVLADDGNRYIDGLPGLAPGENELVAYSLPGMISLTPATALLRAIFPGLRETGRQPYSVIEPAAFSELVTDLPDPLTVWIDLPGAETLVLDLLIQNGALQRVQNLALRCCIEPFFVGAASKDDITARMTALGFALVAVNEDDPDWPELHFKADMQARRIRELEAGLASATDEITTLNDVRTSQLEELTKAKAQVETIRAELGAAEAERAARDKALKEAKDAAEAQERDLQESRRTIEARVRALTESEAARLAAETALGEANAALAARDASLEEMKQLAQARFQYLGEEKAKVEKLEASVAAGTAQLAASTKALDEAKAALAARDTALNEAKALAEARRVALEEAKANVESRNKSLADEKKSSETKSLRIAELENRLRLARDELRRAEGQIEIIKDLLLREVGL